MTKVRKFTAILGNTVDTPTEAINVIINKDFVKTAKSLFFINKIYTVFYPKCPNSHIYIYKDT